MHVVLLNQAFYPDVVATAQMAKDLADHLVARGHRVSVVASRSVYGKSGAQLSKRETIDGIEIHRVGASFFGRSNIALRAADFGVFYARAALRLLRVKRPDVVVSFTTPPFVAQLGLINRLFRRSKAVFWLMDMYPDVAVACGVLKPKSLPTRFFDALNRRILRKSDAVVVLGRCMQKLVLDKGTDPSRVHRIPVWADTSGISPVGHADNPFRKQLDLPDNAVVFMYSGNWGIAHDADTICAAMQSVITTPPVDAQSEPIPVRFVFIGGGKRRPEVEAFVREHGLADSVRYLDYLPRDQIRYSLGAADAHLITVKEGLEGMIVPSKLFGIMAAARPSLYVGSPDSEIARILTETDSGECFAEGSVAELAEAMRRFAIDAPGRQRMGTSARAALEGRYDAQTACCAWGDFLEQLVTPGGAAPGDPERGNPERAEPKRAKGVTP
ncbi:MAG: colanic acid biosynthesis glycosyl transferase WcaI [Phycisphaerales bacterium]|jgi:colanic acid biosynthesis glycosyl transferase WcaI